MKLERVGNGKVYFEYRYGGQYVRQTVDLCSLTEFLTGKGQTESNLGEKGLIDFRKFCDEWYIPKSAKLRLKDGSFVREQESVKALARHFGEMPLHNITRADWDTYLEKRLRGEISATGRTCSEGTANKEFKCLRMVLAYAADTGFIRWNVLANAKPRLTDGNRADIWLTQEEIDRFLNSIPPDQKIFRNLFEFRILTGARPEEAARFGKNNIDRAHGEIWLETLKAKKSAGVQVRQRYFAIESLGQRFERLLGDMTPHPQSGLYFCNPKTGKPFANRYVINVFNRAVTAAGITKRLPLVPYDLRGTFATHRAMVISQFRQLQLEMGHASPQSIQHYLDAASHMDKNTSVFGVSSPTA